MMDTKILGGLVNSISRFILLVSCQSVKSVVALKDLRTMVSILKSLKSVLDEIHDSEILSNDQLLDLFEELDVLVNEARDTLEKQPTRMSKLCNAFRIGVLVLKIQESSMRLFCFLRDFIQSSPSALLSTCIQQSIQEIQYADQGVTSVLIENALLHQKEPDKELVMKIAESVGLTSNLELLAEWICLEKEKEKELHRTKEETVLCFQIFDLFNQIRDCLEKLDQFAVKNQVPIPTYFRCHLSLELMVDPVILASGQTYERSFIQKWLDNGLKICPKTHQPLPHSTLVPNDIVKALIANWCRENRVKVCNPVESRIELFPCSCSSASDENYNDSLDKDSSSIHCHEIKNGSQHGLGMLDHNGNKEGFAISHQLTTETAPNFSSLILQEPYSHGRSESVSSINSTTELLGKLENRTNSLEYMAFSSAKDLTLAPWLSSESGRHSNLEIPNDHGGHALSVSSATELLTASHVQKLIQDLNGQSLELQANAALELRLLAKDSRDNRILIAKCDAINPLVSLLYSNSQRVQENAVTALLNLTINDRENKVAIAEPGGIDPFIHVLRHGNPEARGNAAAALFSLSTIDEFRTRIGRSGAVRPLVDLLCSGSLRGKKDAAAALFNLSIFHENKARIVRAGAVKHLVELLDPEKGMIDKSVALLANLSTVPEGCLAISQEGGIPLLVEVVDTGSQRGKENAASTLLQLCVHSQKLGSMVLQEGAIPPLVALSQQGTPRARDKAQQILSHFRSLRERAVGKGNNG